MKQTQNSKPFAPSPTTLAGDNADIYFLRSRQILEAEELDPVVGAEIFARRAGTCCGLKEVHALLGETLSKDHQVWSLRDGDEIRAGEVVLQVRAPYRQFGLYETALLGYLSSGTGWATAAARCVKAANGLPLICFGARHLHPEASAAMEYAAIVGGCVGCATTAGAQRADLQATGTLPHALILCMGDTLAAAEAFDRHMDGHIQRIVLVDTFRDEAEESLRMARALGDGLWGVRLDTPSERGGVTSGLVREVRARLNQESFQHVKIVASGGFDAERIARFRAEQVPVDAFGIGSAISGAAPIDFTMDIKEVDGKALAKRGRIPGLSPSSRLQRIDI